MVKYSFRCEVSLVLSGRVGGDGREALNTCGLPLKPRCKARTRAERGARDGNAVVGADAGASDEGRGYGVRRHTRHSLRDDADDDGQGRRAAHPGSLCAAGAGMAAGRPSWEWWGGDEMGAAAVQQRFCVMMRVLDVDICSLQIRRIPHSGRPQRPETRFPISHFAFRISHSHVKASACPPATAPATARVWRVGGIMAAGYPPSKLQLSHFLNAFNLLPLSPICPPALPPLSLQLEDPHLLPLHRHCRCETPLVYAIRHETRPNSHRKPPFSPQTRLQTVRFLPPSFIPIKLR